MAITIANNISALKAQRNLAKNSGELSNVFERLSSGMRINRASDDAAGLAIADSLRTDSRLFTQAIRNANDGLSLLAISTGALQQLSGIVTRITELAEQSANGTYSNQQRSGLDQEAQALRNEFTRIVESTSFNGLKLLDGSNAELTLQVGINSQSGARIQSITGATVFSSRWDGTFQSIASTTTTGNATSSFTFDFDGDGDLDVITSNDSTQQSFFRNNGDGTLGPEVTTSSIGSSLVVEDFDRDGTGELAIYDSTNGLRRYELQSNGTFALQSTITASTAYRPRGVTDLTGDGFEDILTWDTTGGTIGVFMGNGNGTFKAIQTYTHANTQALTAGDINGDGRMDLVATNSTNNVASIFMGNSDGTFLAPTTFTASGVASFGMDLVDLNGDGKLDFLSARFPSSATVHFGNGNGTFDAHSIVASQAMSGSIRPHDLDGDGDLDLIRQDATNADFYIYTNNGDGTFAVHSSFSTQAATAAGFSTLGDLTGDGILDIVAPGGNGRTLEIYAGGDTDSYTLGEFSLATQEDSLQALDDMRETLQQLATSIGSIGAYESRINVAIANLLTARENTLAAESRIRDADIAAETSRLTQLTILQQSAAAVLSQANQQPALVLQLLNR